MIKTKLKICSNCNELTVLWKSTPRLCKDCYHKLKSKGEIKASKSLSSIKGKVSAGKIKSISDKRLLALKEYRVVRDRYLSEHRICEHPECSEPSTELHHKRGRVGELLSDARYFCALCHRHHEWVEKNPILAKELGLSKDRLSIDQ